MKYIYVAQVFKETVTSSAAFNNLSRAKAFAEDSNTTLETDIDWKESYDVWTEDGPDTWTWENKKGDEFIVKKIAYFE